MKVMVVALLVVLLATLGTSSLFHRWVVRVKPNCVSGLCFGKRSITLTPCATEYPQKVSDYDENGDGLISLTELAEATGCSVARSRVVFKQADKNGDGFIDDNEFQFSDMNTGQKFEKAVGSYDEVGEVVRDATEYFNQHGKKDIEVEITENDRFISNENDASPETSMKNDDDSVENEYESQENQDEESVENEKQGSMENEEESVKNEEGSVENEEEKSVEKEETDSVENEEEESEENEEDSEEETLRELLEEMDRP